MFESRLKRLKFCISLVPDFTWKKEKTKTPKYKVSPSEQKKKPEKQNEVFETRTIGCCAINID